MKKQYYLGRTADGDYEIGKRKAKWSVVYGFMDPLLKFCHKEWEQITGMKLKRKEYKPIEITSNTKGFEVKWRK